MRQAAAVSDSLSYLGEVVELTRHFCSCGRRSYQPGPPLRIGSSKYPGENRMGFDTSLTPRVGVCFKSLKTRSTLPIED